MLNFGTITELAPLQTSAMIRPPVYSVNPIRFPPRLTLPVMPVYRAVKPHIFPVPESRLFFNNSVPGNAFIGQGLVR